jgi:hypothetical protein
VFLVLKQKSRALVGGRPLDAENVDRNLKA